MTHATNWKPRPKLLDKRQVKAEIAAADRAENARVKARSGGQCEVRVSRILFDGHPAAIRCPRRASHVHHLISGIGRRNRGPSIETAHKLHVCEACHEEIHGHVLVPVDGTQREDAATVRYERVR